VRISTTIYSASLEMKVAGNMTWVFDKLLLGRCFYKGVA